MRYLLLLLISLCTCGPAQAQTHKGLFIFGHSLIDHRPPAIPTPSDETTVPHWLYLLADAAGNSLAAGGQYGFLTSHRNLPPISQWGYDIVPGVWESDTEPFTDADVNTVLITAANFIQTDMGPFDEYYGEDNVGVTPVSATEEIADWVEGQKPGTTIYIYENWPETNLAISSPTYPITPTDFATYNAFTQGDFNDWWITYHDALLASRPGLNIRMIPVGPILAKLFSPGNLLDQIPYTELYEDLDPHGRANTYFLAGLVTYAAIFGQPAPADYTPPAMLHQDVRDNYAAINTLIWDELQAFNTQVGDSRVFSDGAMPLTLSSFTAENMEETVLLTWSTSLETGINRFGVERRGATGDFQPIGEVAANNMPSGYNFTDETPLVGENTYRLRIEQEDGNASYSPLVNVTREGTNSVQLLATGNGTFLLKDAPLGTEYYFTDSAGRLLQKGVVSVPRELLQLSDGQFRGVGFLVAILPGQVPVHFRVLLTR